MDFSLGRGRLPGVGATHCVFQTPEARDAQVSDGMQQGMVDSYERLDERLARRVPIA